MKIVIGSDKAGFSLKTDIVSHIKESTHHIVDIGPENGEDRVSFVQIADKLCKRILTGKAERGILVCGTGMGMSISANKHKGIYAAAVESVYAARMCRLINNANVLCLGGFILGKNLAFEIVKVFLELEYLQDFEEWRKDFLNSQLEALENIEFENFK